MTAQMRTGPAARDPNFRGIDPPALDRLITQMRDAQTAIRGWLNGHRPPPGVSAAGYRQADEVAQWVGSQLGMLSRRYNYAITHPDGGSMQAPPSPAPSPEAGRAPVEAGGAAPAPVAPPRRDPVAQAPRTPDPGRAKAPPAGGGLSSRGAGDIGSHPDRRAAEKAAEADARALRAAFEDGAAVPAAVWTRLKADADDPDYTARLYERLGPAGTARLLAAGEGDAARLRVIRESLGMASNEVRMDVAWLRAFLAEAERVGVRPVAVQVLTGVDWSARTQEAVGKLDLATSEQDPAAPRRDP
ncbi:hypothetical protein [Actinomadura sp. WMMB 499]|uniref:hypothetical protein n=1 Tax=Actinomadura sp. WMMB 499 TaxID=1219491 RepID=UPI001245F9DC|nr:hypothetical protein [Actinomadura sp. WMMB 499]QFG25848.1 hypothetical protein F7P10_36590 [Actinomadura sp. WMMB 499]